MSDGTEIVGVARYEFNMRTGKYDVYCRYNTKGKFRKCEEWATEDFAQKSVIELANDDKLRHQIVIDVKDWDWDTNDIREPRKRGRVPMSKEERERKKQERREQSRVTFSFEE